MDRHDDPAITGLLYRRIPNTGGKTKWDASGKPTFGKSNFIDGEKELSLRIAIETTPEKTLQGHDGFGLAQISVEQIRTICSQGGVAICRDERDPTEGHVLVCGNITEAMAKRLQKAATWVPGYLPIPPEEGIGVD